MDDARTSQFVLEECAEPGQTRFDMDDQLAAIAVHHGMSAVSSLISWAEWVGNDRPSWWPGLFPTSRGTTDRGFVCGFAPLGFASFRNSLGNLGERWALA